MGAEEVFLGLPGALSCGAEGNPGGDPGIGERTLYDKLKQYGIR